MMKIGKNIMPGECWFIWLITIILTLGNQLVYGGDNPYLAALCVMGFIHYLNKAGE